MSFCGRGGDRLDVEREGLGRRRGSFPSQIFGSMFQFNNYLQLSTDRMIKRTFFHPRKHNACSLDAISTRFLATFTHSALKLNQHALSLSRQESALRSQQQKNSKEKEAGSEEGAVGLSSFYELGMEVSSFEESEMLDDECTASSWRWSRSEEELFTPSLQC